MFKVAVCAICLVISYIMPSPLKYFHFFKIRIFQLHIWYTFKIPIVQRVLSIGISSHLPRIFIFQYTTRCLGSYLLLFLSRLTFLNYFNSKPSFKSLYLLTQRGTKDCTKLLKIQRRSFSLPFFFILEIASNPIPAYFFFHWI